MRLRLAVIIVALLFLLVPLKTAHCQDYLQYEIQVNGDSSASWTVTQVSDINASVDTWNGFQQRVGILLEAARNETHREMTIDPNSLQMETTTSWENNSKTTEYLFAWQNFSTIQNGNIVFGDVFRTPEFFGQLYGEGVLQITYQANYIIKSVLPKPSEQDDTKQTLKWFRTQDFTNGKPSVTLTSNLQSGYSMGFQQSAIVVIVVATAIGGSMAGLFVIRRHKRKEEGTPEIPTPKGMPGFESEEEKVLKVIRSSGGSVNQTIIAEQCRFSKAKTSQLLSALEQKGVVNRHKKGRDKIVILAQQH